MALRSWALLEKVYGPAIRKIWVEQPPSAYEINEWLRSQKNQWTARPWPCCHNNSKLPPLLQALSIAPVLQWARHQNLKGLDWYAEPGNGIWFREPEVAMIWDLCGPK